MLVKKVAAILVGGIILIGLYFVFLAAGYELFAPVIQDESKSIFLLGWLLLTVAISGVASCLAGEVIWNWNDC